MTDVATTFHVVVEYPADEFDETIDERIEKYVDRDPDFTGCGLWANATRDIGWYCKTVEEADAIASSIRDGYEGWPPIEIAVRKSHAAKRHS